MVMWGAWTVASYYKKQENDVVYLDENNEDNFLEKFKEIIPSRDMVGFSITSMQIKYTLPLAKYIKENYPNIKTVIGGIHVILYPNQNYKDFFDEAVAGELPKDYFDYSLLPEKVKEVYRKKRAQVVTGFNCSYKCTFCINSVRNARYEGMPAEKIKKEIDYVIKEFNPPKIYFRDEDFFQDFNKARQIVDYILEKHNFKWEATCRVNYFRKDLIDDEFLRKLVKSHCKQLRFGIESGSQRVLNFLHKGQTVKQIKYAVKQCNRYGISPNCSFMIGMPTETPAEQEETYNLIDELFICGKVDLLGPQMYRPYPGGLLFEEAKKYGLKLPDTLEDWAAYYDKNPLGDVFDTKIDYPWLSEKNKKRLPFAWIVVHYGLNYLQRDSLLKKIIGYWFYLHWKRRWFGGWDIKLLMFLRKKLFKTDLD